MQTTAYGTFSRRLLLAPTIPVHYIPINYSVHQLVKLSPYLLRLAVTSYRLSKRKFHNMNPSDATTQRPKYIGDEGASTQRARAVATMGSVIMFSVPNDSVITVLVEESRPSPYRPLGCHANPFVYNRREIMKFLVAQSPSLQFKSLRCI